MIVIEFGGNALRTNTCQQPEKLADDSSENGGSLAHNSQVETSDCLARLAPSQTALTYPLPEHCNHEKSTLLLHNWIEEHVFKPLGF